MARRKTASESRRKKKSLVGWKREGKGFAYYFKETVAKRLRIKKIEFLGFKDRPVGFSLYKTGGGFNKKQSNKIGGDFLLTFLANKYKKVTTLVIDSESEKSYIRVLKRNVVIGLGIKAFSDVLKDLGDEIKEKRELIVEKRLARYLPDHFRSSEEISHTPAVKLSEVDLNNLENSGHEAIAEFIKRYFVLNGGEHIAEKLRTELVIQGQKRTLDDVIRKFEEHIIDKDFDEKNWQKFLHEEVFFFISSYVESIREANVNFGSTQEGEKKPDFVWIDIYGFLDVFEIKTPFTDILARRIDKSHKNYYFSSDAAKAISQIEKYILFLEKNASGFESYLSRQTKVPFSVLKPKAFLIIGNSKEFEGSVDKKRDFRLLRRLFKNIEFITFDELLDNLRNLLSKFEQKAR